MCGKRQAGKDLAMDGLGGDVLAGCWRKVVYIYVSGWYDILREVYFKSRCSLWVSERVRIIPLHSPSLTDGARVWVVESEGKQS